MEHPPPRRRPKPANLSTILGEQIYGNLQFLNIFINYVGIFDFKKPN